jgi:hypothetical protein
MICLVQTEYSVKGVLYPRENVALRNTLMFAKAASEIESSERQGPLSAARRL